MRRGNDLEVVTAPNDAADDEIGQNCKEKRVLRAIALSGVWGRAPRKRGVGQSPTNRTEHSCASFVVKAGLLAYIPNAPKRCMMT
ncbi:MAG: hypothetical protein WC966_00845 [Bradymonadales bacterium]